MCRWPRLLLPMTYKSFQQRSTHPTCALNPDIYPTCTKQHLTDLLRALYVPFLLIFCSTYSAVGHCTSPSVAFSSAAGLVCVLQVRLFFPRDHIQHPQCPCRCSSSCNRERADTSFVVVVHIVHTRLRALVCVKFKMSI